MADPEQTGKERDRAFDLLQEVLQLHVAARRSIILAATLPDADERLASQIAVNERIRRGRKRLSFDEDLLDGQDVVAIAQHEHEKDFDRLRRLTLVAACGALEYLTKAAYVDRVAQDPDKARALLDQVKLKLNASEVVSLDATERWYAVADRLFDHLGEQSQSRPHAVRIQRMLTEFAPPDDVRNEAIVKAFRGQLPGKLNEAFAVRNCLVHSGGRVSAILSRFTGYTRSETIVLGRDSGPRLLSAIRDAANAIRAQHLEF